MESICKDLEEYRIHKDKSGIDRFAKGSSDTMKTLKDLKEKGVKVSLHF